MAFFGRDSIFSGVRLDNVSNISPLLVAPLAVVGGIIVPVHGLDLLSYDHNSQFSSMYMSMYMLHVHVHSQVHLSILKYMP